MAARVSVLKGRDGAVLVRTGEAWVGKTMRTCPLAPRRAEVVAIVAIPDGPPMIRLRLLACPCGHTRELRWGFPAPRFLSGWRRVADESMVGLA